MIASTSVVQIWGCADDQIKLPNAPKVVNGLSAKSQEPAIHIATLTTARLPISRLATMQSLPEERIALLGMDETVETASGKLSWRHP